MRCLKTYAALAKLDTVIISCTWRSRKGQRQRLSFCLVLCVVKRLLKQCFASPLHWRRGSAWVVVLFTGYLYFILSRLTRMPSPVLHKTRAVTGRASLSGNSHTAAAPGIPQAYWRNTASAASGACPERRICFDKLCCTPSSKQKQMHCSIGCAPTLVLM